MNFFSGFSLLGEEELFKEYLKDTPYSVGGFSLGAVKAFEYVQNCRDRVDILQLFSPAFFQNRSEKFKRVQTINYQKNREGYQKQFLENIAYPSSINMQRYFVEDTLESLQKLLKYNWNPLELEKVKDSGVEIEVYLGEKDKIIESQYAYDFFKHYATVYFIKGVGHILDG